MLFRKSMLAKVGKVMSTLDFEIKEVHYLER